MPLKLLMVALLLAISLPVVAKSIDGYQASVGQAAVRAEASRLAAAIAEVYAAGEGNVRVVTVELPPGPGSRLEVGGEGIEGMCVQGSAGGTDVPPVYLDDPPVRVVATSGTLVVGPGDSQVRLECLRADGRLVVLAGAA